jgi:hypothetical protein
MTSFFVEDKGGAFERCPRGMHLARCYRIVDLGTQKSEYMGQVKYLHKIMISWEIHGMDENGKPLRMSDGRPYGIFKNYTLSWSEKSNLRLDLQSWRGRPFLPEEMRRFDLKNILGAWCMLNVIERTGQNGKEYSNIDGITPVPSVIKHSGLPEGVNALEIFNLSEPDMQMFDKFHEGLKKKIMASPEWGKLQGKPEQGKPEQREPGSDDDLDEDIPF